MFKFWIKFCICISVVCYSAVLYEHDFSDMERILLNGFDTNLKQLKQTYLTRIKELKQNAINCTLNGSCFEITEKVAYLNKMFRESAKEMTDIEKESLKQYQRRNYIRCLDCVSDYFDDIFSGFCDDMDEVESETKPPALLLDPGLASWLQSLASSAAATSAPPANPLILLSNNPSIQPEIVGTPSVNSTTTANSTASG